MNETELHLAELEARIAALEARFTAPQSVTKPAPPPPTVTIDKAAFDEAITTLREAWEEVFGMPISADIRIDTAIRLLTEH